MLRYSRERTFQRLGNQPLTPPPLRGQLKLQGSWNQPGASKHNNTGASKPEMKDIQKKQVLSSSSRRMSLFGVSRQIHFPILLSDLTPFGFRYVESTAHTFFWRESDCDERMRKNHENTKRVMADSAERASSRSDLNNFTA